MKQPYSLYQRQAMPMFLHRAAGTAAAAEMAQALRRPLASLTGHTAGRPNSRFPVNTEPMPITSSDAYLVLPGTTNNRYIETNATASSK
jgi:hypothetical protein